MSPGCDHVLLVIQVLTVHELAVSYESIIEELEDCKIRWSSHRRDGFTVGLITAGWVPEIWSLTMCNDTEQFGLKGRAITRA